MRLLAPLFAVLGSPIAAEDVTQEFLEQPGIVWVSANTPAAAKAGEIIPLISYAIFSDGMVETGFVAHFPAIMHPSCEHPSECVRVTNQAANRQGVYSISGGTLTADAPILGQWIFDRRESFDAVQASDVLPFGEAQLARDGDVLVQYRPEGERRYLALPEDQILSGIAVSYVFELSFNETYDCAMSILADLRAIPEADRTQAQSNFLALARHGNRALEATIQTQIILPDAIAGGVDELPVASRRYYEHFKALRTAYTFPIGLMSADMAETGSDEPSAKALEQIAELLPRVTRNAPSFAPILAEYEATYPDILATAQTLNRFVDFWEEGIEPNTILCTRLILQ